MAKLQKSVDKEGSTSQNNPSTSASKINEIDKNSDKSSDNNISISSRVSDSSADSDTDSDFDEVKLPSAGAIVLSSRNSNNDNKEIISSESGSSKPNFDSVVVQNSSDITFGNKTFYQGPVTIKQFLLDKDRWKNCDNGISNNGFQGGSSNGSIDKNKEEIEGLPPKHLENWFYKLHPIKRNGLIGIAIFFILVLFSTVLLVIITLSAGKKKHSRGSKEENAHVPINSNTDDDIIDEKAPLRIISRLEWLAEPAKNGVDPLVLPVQRVIIAHTATETCKNQPTCVFRVRFLQTYHLESLSYQDIAYNFLVGDDGNIYEGRGWNFEGALAPGFTQKTLSIALIGSFRSLAPEELQLNRTQEFIHWGVRTRRIASNYKLYGEYQFSTPNSPGQKAMEIIQKWPNWVNETHF